MGGSHSSSGPSALQSQRVGLQNQLGKEIYGTGQGIFSTEMPTLTGELKNPLTPQERSAIFETAMAPQTSAFDAMAQNAAQRAARTRNPAGLLESDEQLAREKGQALSNSAMNAETVALKIQDQRRQDALNSLSQLYGIDMSTMARLLGGMPSQQSSGFSFRI